MNTRLHGLLGWFAVAMTVITGTQIARAGPFRVTDLAVISSNGAVVVSWTAPNPSQGNTLTALDVRYDVNPINALNWSSKANVSWLTDPGTPGTIQTATIPDLLPGTNYYVAIKNLDSSGTWSTVSNLALAVAGGPSYAVWLAWNPSPDSGVIGYLVYVGTSSGVYSTNYFVGNVTTYSVSNLQWGVTYYFAATATNSTGMESLFSNECTYSRP